MEKQLMWDPMRICLRFVCVVVCGPLVCALPYIVIESSLRDAAVMLKQVPDMLFYCASSDEVPEYSLSSWSPFFLFLIFAVGNELYVGKLVISPFECSIAV